ncbi:PepSY-associated TM helix domain-containing protein [Acinetobacter rudis]|uniref:PepSY-associated TM helix domain-containing protein n=1 Tax=Acinetobacter rudis TaxID=632955 RepID=UPI00280CC20C|nr:PepSY-associated TM helix domain-containing protein [Acinetobacter rudis]MDQ8952570.1 PepSY-associated TM helix domain-containing protein [Acinetobacter rudis]
MKVRTDILKIAKELHTWVGISAGVLLFICFFAGGLTMFQHDLSRWATPPQQRLAQIAPTQFNQLVQQTQAAFPESIRNFQINVDSKEYHHAPMMWQSKQQLVAQDQFDTAQNSMLATLSTDGRLHVQQENRSNVGWLIEQLHETGGIPGMFGHHTIGVYVMGIVALLYFMAMMTGLILLLPTLVKDYFAVRKGKNKKRFWLDTHNVVGISSLPFHIIISVTVIVFAFHDVFYDAMAKLAYADRPMFERRAELKLDQPTAQLDVEQILLRLQQQAPDYQVSSIRFTQADQPEKAMAFAALYSPNHMLRGDRFDYLVFNPYQTTPYDVSSLNAFNAPLDKLLNSMFSLHFGNFGGDFTRWIYLVLGMGGAFLFYSGNLLWLESRVKRQKNPQIAVPEQAKSVRFVACLTVGACLGCVLAIFTTMLFGRWAFVLIPQLSSINHLLVYSYYVIFLSCLIYSFCIGAARALPHLLFAIAIVLLLIPFTSLCAYLFPVNGLWYSNGSLWWIDVFALIFAGLFLRFYQQARVRAQHAAKGSLWSA